MTDEGSATCIFANGARMTWTHRIRLTIHDAVFAGREASLMRELVHVGKWSAECSGKEADCELVSLRDQVQLVQRLESIDAEAVAVRFGLMDFGAAGAAVLACRDLHSAISAMNSFAPLLNLRHTLRLKACDDVYVMTFHVQSQDQQGSRDVLLFVDVAKVLRFLEDWSVLGDLGSEDRPVGTQGQNVKAHADESRSLPYACRCGEHIRIPKSLMGRRRPLASPAVSNAHHRECRKMMRELRERALCGYVRRILLHCPDACPSMLQLATRLGMSGRSFRRHLANQHTTFQEILDGVRFELAIRYLEDRQLTTELIAQKLGYSESANFRAAFRRWTGLSPRHFDIRGVGVATGPERRVLVDESRCVQCV
jgi:AraC-like DNA-binding protein